MSNAIKKLSLLSSLILLQGCATFLDDAERKFYEQINTKSKQAQTDIRAPLNPAPLVQEQQVSIFATRSIALNKSEILPGHIEKVTFKYPGRLTLSQIAERIHKTTGIITQMTPDALLDPALFSPNQSGARAARPNAGGNQNAASESDVVMAELGVPHIDLSDEEYRLTFELNYEGSLTGFLDMLANKAQLRWAYEDNKIVFRRIVTESIPIVLMPGSSSDTAVWSSITQALPMYVSSQGKYAINQQFGYVVVTDAVANVDQITRFLNKINESYLRQVSIEVQVIQVDLNESARAGINWENLTRDVGRGITLSASGVAEAGTSTGAQATPGRIALTRNDSNIIITRLEQFGRVSSLYSSVVNTLHRQAVPLKVTLRENYVRSITAGSVTNGTVLGPSIEVGELESGFDLNLMPVILNSNRVLIQTELSVSSVRQIDSFTVGVGASQSAVQQPKIDKFENTQRAGMRLGDTMVMLAYEFGETRANTTDIVQNVIPGSRSVSEGKKSIIILLTPRLTID